MSSKIVGQNFSFSVLNFIWDRKQDINASDQMMIMPLTEAKFSETELNYTFLWLSSFYCVHKPHHKKLLFKITYKNIKH